jgi:hypothetical protein
MDEEKFCTELLRQVKDLENAKKMNLLHLITSLLFRISFVVSIWLFIFDPEKWLAAVVFLVLVLITSVK